MGNREFQSTGNRPSKSRQMGDDGRCCISWLLAAGLGKFRKVGGDGESWISNYKQLVQASLGKSGQVGGDGIS